MASISSNFPEIHRSEVAAKIVIVVAITHLVATIITLGLALADKISPIVPGCCFATIVALSIPFYVILKYQIKKAETYKVNLHELYSQDSIHEMLVEPLLIKLLPKKA